MTAELLPKKQMNPTPFLANKWPNLQPGCVFPSRTADFIPEGGHLVMREMPDQINALLGKWLSPAQPLTSPDGVN